MHPRRRMVVPATVLVVLGSSTIVLGSVPGEVWLAERITDGTGPAADDLADVISRSTDSWIFAVAAVFGSLVLWRCGHRWSTGLVAAVAVLVLVGNPLLKELIQAPRPDVIAAADRARSSTYRFPSAHAANVTAAVLLVWTFTTGTRYRKPARTVAAALAVLVLTSQLVLGRHHVSDLVAGAALSSLIVETLAATPDRQRG